MADQNTGLEKNSGSQRSSLSPILSLVRIFPAENQTRGFEKAGGSEQESICFLFFHPEFRGEQKQKTKKQKRQSRHIYRIRSWRSPKKKNKAGFYEISIFPSRL
jgi:hypothetical protein